MAWREAKCVSASPRLASPFFCIANRQPFAFAPPACPLARLSVSRRCSPVQSSQSVPGSSSQWPSRPPSLCFARRIVACNRLLLLLLLLHHHPPSCHLAIHRTPFPSHTHTPRVSESVTLANTLLCKPLTSRQHWLIQQGARTTRSQNNKTCILPYRSPRHTVHPPIARRLHLRQALLPVSPLTSFAHPQCPESTSTAHSCQHPHP